MSEPDPTTAAMIARVKELEHARAELAKRDVEVARLRARIAERDHIFDLARRIRERGYNLRSKLDYVDRALFDELNQAVDGAVMVKAPT